MHPNAERSFSFVVNGLSVSIEADPGAPLLYILRNDLALNGPKFGCGLGECGACCVLIDGKVARSCVVPLACVGGRVVTTLEGLGNSDTPSPVQAAFISAQAAQCGYCLNGMVVTAHALLAHRPKPTRAEIAQALKYNLCRCGTHVEILQAVEKAAAAIQADGSE